MKPVALLAPAIFAALAVPAPALAGELFGGVYVHDVKTPLDKSGIESGLDLMAGYRFGRIAATPIQPYILGAVNTAGETSYAAAGLSAKFGGKVYVRPGVGLAIHSGSAANYYRTDKIAFGSRVLFEPEVALGVELNGRTSVEASWVHMSHGQLFGRENPGIDNFGVRLNLKL